MDNLFTLVIYLAGLCSVFAVGALVVVSTNAGGLLVAC